MNAMSLPEPPPPSVSIFSVKRTGRPRIVMGGPWTPLFSQMAEPLADARATDESNVLEPGDGGRQDAVNEGGERDDGILEQLVRNVAAAGQLGRLQDHAAELRLRLTQLRALLSPASHDAAKDAGGVRRAVDGRERDTRGIHRDDARARTHDGRLERHPD